MDEVPTNLPPSPAVPAPRHSAGCLTGAGGLAMAGIGLLFLIAAGVFVLLGDGVSFDEATRRPAVIEGGDDLPTWTARSSASPEPTLFETSRPTQVAPPASGAGISAENMHLIEELARLGRGTLTALDISPDGAMLAVAGSLGVWLYDVETMQPIELLEGHTKPAADVAWSPDGTRLVSAGGDGMLLLWRLSRGNDDSLKNLPFAQVELVLRGHIGAVTSVAWSPDGGWLASGGWDDTVRIWQVSQGGPSLFGTVIGDGEPLVLASHTEGVTDVAWSPNGLWLASASRDGTVRLWLPLLQEANSEATGTREFGVLKGHDGGVNSVTWSPDGALLASCGDDETVRIWSLPEQRDDISKRQLATLTGHSSYVKSVAWSPDGTQLASVALDRTVRVWDVANGEEVLVLKGHTQPVRGLSWLPNGSGVVSGGDDGMVLVWDAADGSLLRSLTAHLDTVLSVAWSPDGTRLAAGNRDGTVAIWSLVGESDEPAGDTAVEGPLFRLVGHRSEVNSVAWSPNGTQLASAGGILDARVLLWDTGTFDTARLLEGHTSTVLGVAWSPDGSRLASASWDNRVRVWDATGRPVRTLTDHRDWVLNVAWAPDGTGLAAGSRDGTVRIWAADGDKQLRVLEGHTDRVSSVAWSPDAMRLASVSWDKTLRIWEVATGRQLMVWQMPGTMAGLSWSPDGTLLAIAPEFQDGLWIWDVKAGQDLLTLQGHVDYVKAVAWSPDGTRLASASADGTVRVWGIPDER